MVIVQRAVDVDISTNLGDDEKQHGVMAAFKCPSEMPTFS